MTPLNKAAWKGHLEVVRDFKDTAFTSLRNHLQILRETCGLRIVVFLFLRIGAPELYLLKSIL